MGNVFKLLNETTCLCIGLNVRPHVLHGGYLTCAFGPQLFLEEDRKMDG